MPRINIEKPPGEALKALARKSLAALAKDLKAGGGVHDARKRLKFLRSLLRLIRHGLGEEAFGRANGLLRAAAHALAGARRAAAMQEIAAKLKGAEELARIAAAAHQVSVAPEALRAAQDEAAAGVSALQGEIRGWSLPRNDISLFEPGLEHAYRRARRKLAEGLEAGDIDLLHEARKSVIHHLHHVEILAPLWPDMMRVWSKELLKLREALGDLHDLEELEALMRAEAHAFSSEAARAQAAEAISARRKELLKRVRRRVEHLFAEKPRAYAARIAAMWQTRVD